MVIDMRTPSILALALAALLLAGCAATPTQRIERDPAGFAALPAEQQQRVKEGSVGVGFDTAAVRLAYGEPDRIVERETTEGASQVWVYYSVVPGFAGSGYCGPGIGYYGYNYYCRPFVPTQYEERTRIVFKDGKVTSVENIR